MSAFPVTLTLDTSAYISGDLLADTQLVSAAVAKAGKEAFIDYIKITDKDDQGQALELVFLKSNTSLGVENSVPNISDANVAAALIAQVAVAAVDYIDYGGAKFAHKPNLGVVLPLAVGESLYIGAISLGTGTYSAAGLVLEIGIKYR